MKMQGRRIFIFLMLISNYTLMTESVTHWIQNNAGLIVPLLTSPYYMKNSNDLVAFLNQSIHKKKLDDLMNQLLLIKSNLTTKMTKLDSLFSELPNRISCIPDFFMDDSDLILQLSIQYFQRINFRLKNENLEKSSPIPRCAESLKIDISNELFGNLEGIKKRSKLKMERDDSFELNDLGTTSITFPQVVNTFMKTKPDSWKSYLLSSYYWRYKGNAKEAIECSIRALHLAPSKLKDVPLLSLGTILQRSNYLNDSLIVIKSAFNHAPHIIENLWNLCNNYFLLSQFKNLFECYDYVESQDGAFKEKIESIKNSILCFRDLKRNLNSMEISINQISPELEQYRRLKVEFEKIHEEIDREQVPLNVRDFDEKFIEHKNNLIQRNQICSTRFVDKEDESPVLYCDFLSDNQLIMQDFALDLLDDYVELKKELISTYKINSLGIFKNVFVENLDEI